MQKSLQSTTKKQTGSPPKPQTGSPSAWGVPQIPNKKPIQVPLPTSKSDPQTRSQTKSITERIYKPGTIIRKNFGKIWHEGEVRSYNPKSKFYRVNYQDGDIEDMEYHEIKPLVKGDQKYKAYTCRKAYSLMLKYRQETRQSPKQVAHAAVV